MLGNVLGGRDGSFVVAEWKQAGTPDGQEPEWVAPLHRHLSCDEGWYVLEGCLAVQIDGEIFTASAGSAIWAARGSAHTYWNPGRDESRYLLFMTPKTYALIQGIHGLTSRDHETVRTLFKQHDAVLL